MGMTTGYLQVTGQQLEGLIAGSTDLDEMLMGSIMGETNSINIDKAWHGIHFILTGNAWEGVPPLGNVVLGGTEIGEDMGFGPARYLTVEEVNEIASALQPIDAETFTSRYDPEAMSNNEIYAFNIEDAEDEIEYFRSYYLQLRDYYFEAAKQQHAMLLYMV